jgi:VWFA-related protein
MNNRRKAKDIAYLTISALLCTIMSVAALDDSSQKQDIQQFRVKTELMEVRTVVTDKQGRIVENLKMDDFELLENNHPQTISFFSVSQVESKESRPASGKSTVQDKTVESTPLKQKLSEAPVRTTLLLVDNLHVSFSNLNAVKQALRRFINEQLTDQDMVALATSSGTLGIAQQFSRNRQLIRYAIEQIRPGPVQFQSYFPTSLAARVLNEPRELDLSGYFYEDLCQSSNTCIAPPGKGNAIRLATDIVRDRDFIECPCSLLRSKALQIAIQTLSEASYSRKVTLSIIRDFAAQMIGMPGKRMIVVFSDGFTMLDDAGATSTNETQSVINRAVRAGVVIYSIDAKGVHAPATLDASKHMSNSEINFSRTMCQDGETIQLRTHRGGQVSVPDPRCWIPDSGDLNSYTSGAEIEEENALSNIAEETGGKAYSGSNNLGAELGRAFDANRFYYVLSYYLPKEEDPNKFRNIKVRVRNHSEYNVRTAKGFLPADITAKEDDEPKTPQERLLKAIRSPLPATDFNVSAQADFIETATDNNQVTLTVYVDGDKFQYQDKNRRKSFGLEVLYAIYDSSGKQVEGNSAHMEGNLTPERLEQAKASGFRFSRRLSLKPGAYQARVGVREEGTDHMGTASAWIEVPELAHDKLGMSGLILRNPLDTDPTAKEGINVSELEQIKMVQGIPLYARNDYCDYLFRVYREKQAVESDLLLMTEVLLDGKPLKEEQWKPIPREDSDDVDSKGWFDLDGELELKGFKPGIYELRLSIKEAQSKKTVQRTAVFGIE